MRTTLPNGVVATGGILERIVEAKAKRLEETRRRVPVDQIAGARRSKTTSIAGVLSPSDGINIIAEIKHRSPSKGVIRQEFDPVRIATSYAEGGAAALSVLAEEDFFGGSLEHLEAIGKRVEVPLLRKDFIFDEYQVYESAAAGADAVLLIVAILEDELL